MSQLALARASGVSPRMIGGVESGSTSVSTATLDRIGAALNVTLAELVSDPALPRSQILNKPGWAGRHGGQGILLSSVEARREVATWEWRLAPGDRYDAGADPPGWHVLLVVVSGCLTLEYAGEAKRIEPGSHLFDSAVPHAFVNRDISEVRFFRSTIC